jgi:hypothetical protein
MITELGNVTEVTQNTSFPGLLDAAQYMPGG